MQNKEESKYKLFFDLSFAKRPSEELYDLSKDPDQIINVANKSEYKIKLHELRSKLENLLKESEDPRIMGEGEKFDSYPYRAGYKLREYPTEKI